MIVRSQGVRPPPHAAPVFTPAAAPRSYEQYEAFIEKDAVYFIGIAPAAMVVWGVFGLVRRSTNTHTSQRRLVMISNAVFSGPL